MQVRIRTLVRGLWEDNPVFRLLIGLCPALAVTTAATYGMAMGLATSFVLICSSTIVSLLKNVIPRKVRIPSYIIIIATFVTIVDLVMDAFLPDLHSVLGLFIPLIVVNCLVLGRSEAFASKNTTMASIVDAIGMGIGFTWALTLLGAVREVFGMGTVFGLSVVWDGFVPWTIMSLPPGAFISLGVLVGLLNVIGRRLSERS